jgi:acrylyl-CoA reductase (NADPH)
MFNAILIDKTDAAYGAKLTQVDESQLPEGNVTVQVDYSTLNYKDGLAITGKSPVVRKFPMVPGIDLAGVVESSDHPDWKSGDDAVLNGCGNKWGQTPFPAHLVQRCGVGTADRATINRSR